MTAAPADDPRPPLLRDRSFWGLNLTQFLGAFNDNLFKQLVMLLCVDRALAGGRDQQSLAMFLFAWPFIAFSGYAGFLSDRFSKRTIIVLCKLAELGIVLLGLIGFLTGSLAVLLAVLCLMGVHSAFFGPSKYGILPELLRSSDLPRANGFMLMATFLAIIFGLAAAGAAKQVFAGSLWLASLPCLVVALIGVGTSMQIRPTEIAEPHLKFAWSSVAIAPETRALLQRDRKLLGVLLMSSVFWFVGGTVYPPAINAFGKQQLRLDDIKTGMMAASTGLGIAIGCVLAGVLSKDRVRGWLVRVGAWGLTLSLAALSLPGPGYDAVREEIRYFKLPSAEQSTFRPTPHQKPQSQLARAISSLSERTLGLRLFFNENSTNEYIEACLLSPCSFNLENVKLLDFIQQIPPHFRINVVIDSPRMKEAGVEGTEQISIHADHAPLKQVLEEVLNPLGLGCCVDNEVLKITSRENVVTTPSSSSQFLMRASWSRGSLLGPYGSVVALIAVGLFSGFFSVPLQVFLQASAPSDQKGRIIGAFNLLNWIGITGSAAVYALGRWMLIERMELPHASLFGFAAVLMLPVALFYRPPEASISS